MTAVRRVAAEVLLAVGRGRTTLAAEVDRARSPFSDRRDRALLVELTVGTLRWRNALDALIEAASGRPIANIDERALAVLRLGVYQLRYLTRVPAHAVVHESVEAVRTLGAVRAAPFVNAVLRSVTRGGNRIQLPKRPSRHRTPRPVAGIPHHFTVPPGMVGGTLARSLRRDGHRGLVSLQQPNAGRGRSTTCRHLGDRSAPLAAVAGRPRHAGAIRAGGNQSSTGRARAPRARRSRAGPRPGRGLAARRTRRGGTARRARARPVRVTRWKDDGHGLGSRVHERDAGARTGGGGPSPGTRTSVGRNTSSRAGSRADRPSRCARTTALRRCV